MMKRDTKLKMEAMEVAREIPILAKGFKRTTAFSAIVITAPQQVS
jgi:hypothetical protein